MVRFLEPSKSASNALLFLHPHTFFRLFASSLCNPRSLDWDKKRLNSPNDSPTAFTTVATITPVTTSINTFVTPQNHHHRKLLQPPMPLPLLLPPYHQHQDASFSSFTTSVLFYI